MIERDRPDGSRERRKLRIRRLSARMLSLFVVVFFTGGMTGGTCNIGLPDSGGSADTTAGQDKGTGGPRLLSDDHTLGSEDATILVFMYADFDSSDCGKFIRNEFATIKSDYIDTNKVRWVYRHFPAGADGELAAAATECGVTQDSSVFFDFHDLIYADQSDLSSDALKAHAATLGLTEATFDTCLSGSSTDTRVQQDVNSGTALGVSSTPTFFVNTQQVTGFQTAAELAEAIDRQLAE